MLYFVGSSAASISFKNIFDYFFLIFFIFSLSQTLYIRPHRPACVSVATGKCFAPNTDAVNHCVTIDVWQWQDLSDPTFERTRKKIKKPNK
jgi:hypothetical protein